MRDVDLFYIALDVDLPGAFTILSDEERARAARFHFDRDRRRFVNCRAKVRTTLGRYLNTDPARIEFRYNEFGKPSAEGIFFNVSHSHDLALLAISRTREVGVDIERIDASFAHDNIPERFFSPGEVMALRALPEHQQFQAFFACWTRKEAYIKARGMGMALALDSFDVTLTPGEPARFLRGAGDWSIESLAPPAGYAAAVVADGLFQPANTRQKFFERAIEARGVFHHQEMSRAVPGLEPL